MEVDIFSSRHTRSKQDSVSDDGENRSCSATATFSCSLNREELKAQRNTSIAVCSLGTYLAGMMASWALASSLNDSMDKIKIPKQYSALFSGTLTTGNLSGGSSILLPLHGRLFISRTRAASYSRVLVQNTTALRTFVFLVTWKTNQLHCVHCEEKKCLAHCLQATLQMRSDAMWQVKSITVRPNSWLQVQHFLIMQCPF